MNRCKAGMPMLLGSLAMVMAQATLAQQPAATAEPVSCQARGFLPGPARYKSVEVMADGKVTFRLCAPQATEVRVTSADMPDVIAFGANGPVGITLARDATGLWSGTTSKAVAPDNYRFSFVVNGVTTPDPQAITFSRERVGTQSTLEVPGADGAFQSYDAKIAHGMVSEFEYWSATLGAKRRVHVYTPPGYFKAAARYPVLYLVHGAGDSDNSWTSTGHAHYILDNLIASGRAKPMIIVMPFGHTPDRPGTNLLANTDFGDDLIKDLMPQIEKNFRTTGKANGRAMAGLSMGGSHTLRYGLTHPELFQYLGVFSMGLGMNNNQADVADYEKSNAASLARAAKETRLVYYGMGKDDFLYSTVAPTRAMLDRQGIKHLYNESTGGHTWINWRRYLQDFLPRLF